MKKALAKAPGRKVEKGQPREGTALLRGLKPSENRFFATISWHRVEHELPDDEITVLCGWSECAANEMMIDLGYHCEGEWRAAASACTFVDEPDFWAELPAVPPFAPVCGNGKPSRARR